MKKLWAVYLQGVMLALCGVMSVQAFAGITAPAPDTATALSRVEIEDARIRLPLPGQTNAVVYLTLLNLSAQELVFNKVEVEGAAKAEFHEHQHKDGIMRMREVTRVDVSAGGALEFKPGSYHIMAFDMQPSDGAKTSYGVSLTLTTGQVLNAQAKPIR